MSTGHGKLNWTNYVYIETIRKQNIKFQIKIDNIKVWNFH